MAISCCRYCVAPKRHPYCHSNCSEYIAEKTEYDRLKAEYDKRQSVQSGIRNQREYMVYKARRKHN